MKKFIQKKLKKNYKCLIKLESKLAKQVFFRKNVFKAALLSYLRAPFDSSKENKKHTNHIECYTIANLLSEIGYNVDICEHDQLLKLNYQKYDLLFGLGLSFEASFLTLLEGLESIMRLGLQQPGRIKTNWTEWLI